MEADTIRAVEFKACKADQVEVLVPTALEKKLFYLRSPKNLEILEKSLTDQLGAKLQLIYFIGESTKSAEAAPAPAPTTATTSASSKPTPPPPNMSQEAFLDDPVIQNALKIFEAKIVATK